MGITDFIINDIIPVSETKRIEEVQAIFSQTTYSHVPVAKEGAYIGCLAEADTHCYDADRTIVSYAQAYQQFFVKQEANWLQVLEAFAQNKTNVLPVLNEGGKYMGYYELADIMSFVGNTPFMTLPGNTVIIEKRMVDYSFSEISQIVESNDGRILGVLISQIVNNTVQISLKTSDTNFNDILAAFRRYGYTIVSSHQEDAFLKDLQERSKYLNKYLNI